MLKEGMSTDTASKCMGILKIRFNKLAGSQK